MDSDGTVASLTGFQPPGAAQHTVPAWHPLGSTSAYQAAATASGPRRGTANDRSAAQEECSPAWAVPTGLGSISGRKRAAAPDDSTRAVGLCREAVAAVTTGPTPASKRQQLETRIPAPRAAAPSEVSSMGPDSQRHGWQAGPCSDLGDMAAQVQRSCT